MAPDQGIEERLRASLADRYTVERGIGSGGMAYVFLAEDLRHRRKVAVKVLRPELAAVLGLERFLSEIEITANLQHPHILPLHDSGEVEGLLYYVMPFVEGESLREKLNRETQLSVDEALKITSDVAGALGSAHKKDVIHRDIKPENILLFEGHALVADFGIALAVTSAGGDRITKTGLSVGTPAYMSPEQVGGDERLDGRADIYALACVLFEMLVGEPPYTGPNAQVILARHLAADIPSIRAARPTVPLPVADAVTKALGKAPSDRYPTAHAFSEALRAEVVVAGPEKKSVAVLPFSNMSPNVGNEYFSDGITEEIINALSRLPGLRVAARTSSFTFKGESPDIREVGAKLKVATVLEGSVRLAGENLRITAQLVNVDDGFQLWAERFDRKMDDVFKVQDEIAEAVVERLRISLLDAPSGTVAGDRTENMDAYEAYLRGRFFWNQRGPGMLKGLAYFQEAVERDPEYAMAHAGIADAFALLGFWGGLKGKESFRKGKDSAQRALQLDPALAGPHACLGFIAMYHDWNWDMAKNELRCAIELNPQYVEAYLFYAQYLGWIEGDGNGAIEVLRYAHEIDPLSVTVMAQLGAQFTNAGQPAEGLAEIERTLELAPNLVNAHWYRSLANRQLGRYEESIEWLRETIPISGKPLHLVGELALCYAHVGRITEAKAILGEGELGTAQPFYVALVYAAMGEIDSAYEWVEKAYEHRDQLLPAIRTSWDRTLDRSDPRFQAVVRRMKLPAQ